MPPRRRFNKKDATTFAVVHRAHEDELYFDNDASRHVLVPVDKKKSKAESHKGLTRNELENKMGNEVKAIRENEGLAAQYGIYYDDSKYDYMQHLKPIGEAEDAVFIAKKDNVPEKKANLLELLKDQLPSDKQNIITQDNLENIPSDLKRFNPNMDPRLREALEALEDEAYIEEGADEDDDIFNDLLKSGEAKQGEGYDEEYDDDDDAAYYGNEDYDEWDLDNYNEEYEKYDDYDGYDSENLEEQVVPYNEGEAPELVDNMVVNTAWEKDFHKFKQSQNKPMDSDDEFDDESINDFEQEDKEPGSEAEEENDQLPSLPTFNKPQKSKKSNTKQRKQKGAMSDTSDFSMSSSAVFRTEGLTLLDDRFEKMAKDFEKEPEEDYKEFKLEEERDDFEGMLDDFLDNYELERGGRKLMKKNEEMKKLQQASDAASNSKVSKKRREAQKKGGDAGLEGFGKLTI